MNKYLLILFLFFLLTGCATTNPQPNIIGENPIVSEKPPLNQSESYFAKFYQNQKGTKEVPAVAQTSGETPTETTETEIKPEPEEIAPPIIEDTAKKRPDISTAPQENNEISKIKQRLDAHDRSINNLGKRVGNLELISKKLDAKLTEEIVWNGSNDPKAYRIGTFAVGQWILDKAMEIQVASIIKRYNEISDEVAAVGKKLTLEIRGYASQSNNPTEAEIKNNIEISGKRAKTVNDALIKGGIKAEITEVKAMGGYTEFAWSSNNQCVRLIPHVK